MAQSSTQGNSSETTALGDHPRVGEHSPPSDDEDNRLGAAQVGQVPRFPRSGGYPTDILGRSPESGARGDGVRVVEHPDLLPLHDGVRAGDRGAVNIGQSERIISRKGTHGKQRSLFRRRKRVWPLNEA